MSTGSVVHGFHEGARSEYLAQYVFSAFGTALLVPRPEDFGLDLYCALSERIGSLMHIRNPYFVQVKSEKTLIEYSGPASAGCLLDLRSPLLICYVSKRENHVEIYQTLELAMHAASGIPRNVVLRFEPAEWPPAAPLRRMVSMCGSGNRF